MKETKKQNKPETIIENRLKNESERPQQTREKRKTKDTKIET